MTEKVNQSLKTYDKKKKVTFRTAAPIKYIIINAYDFEARLQLTSCNESIDKQKLLLSYQKKSMNPLFKYFKKPMYVL